MCTNITVRLTNHIFLTQIDVDVQKKQVQQHNESRDAYNQFREMIQGAEAELFQRPKPVTTSELKEEKVDAQLDTEQPAQTQDTDVDVKSNENGKEKDNTSVDAAPIAQPVESMEVPVQRAQVTESPPVVQVAPIENVPIVEAPIIEAPPVVNKIPTEQPIETVQTNPNQMDESEEQVVPAQPPK